MRKARLLESFLNNPTAIAIVVVSLIVIGIVWYFQQVKEAKESEALRARERGRSDSMWNQ